MLVVGILLEPRLGAAVRITFVTAVRWPPWAVAVWAFSLEPSRDLCGGMGVAQRVFRVKDTMPVT